MKTVGTSKLRLVGGSLGIILQKRIFNIFKAREGDMLIIKYDEENDRIIIERGGM
jgi:hypothetical protein